MAFISFTRLVKKIILYNSFQCSYLFRDALTNNDMDLEWGTRGKQESTEQGKFEWGSVKLRGSQ